MNQQTTTAPEPKLPPGREPDPKSPIEPPPISFGGHAVRLILSLLILAGGFAGAVALVKVVSREPQAERDLVTELPKVETTDIVTHEGGLDIEVDGMAVPFKEIQLAAEVAGRIVFKSEDCRSGNFVKKGTPLIRIDKATYQLDVQRLQRQKTEAEQNITELEVEIKNTGELVTIAQDDIQLRENELARQRRLSKQGVGTATAFEAAERSLLQARNTRTTLDNQKRLLTTRKSRLETSRDLAQIQLEKAELDLARTEIVAPIDGVIVSAMAEADSYVQRGANLLMLEDTSRVEVQCSLTMEELYRLWESTGEQKRGEYDIPDARVSVIYELAGREFGWEGKLARFDGLGLDEKTRTVPCRIVVPSPRNVKEVHTDDSMVDARGGPPALVRGMFVKARLHTNPAVQYLRVPQPAVRPGNKIWIVRDGTVTISKAIVVGVAGDDLLIDGIASKIESGDRAVVSPLVKSTTD